MDATEIRDIMEMAMKLEGIFRHIRFLCGKYEELQNGINPYVPFNEYPFLPGGFVPPINYAQQPYYQPPFNYNSGIETQNKRIPPPNINVNTNKESIQVTKTQKSSIQQKKPQNPTNTSPVLKQVATKLPTSNPSQSNKGYPPSAYHIFLSKKKSQIKKEYPQLGEQELLQIMGEVWKSFDQSQRQPYELQWKRLKYLATTKNKEQKSINKPNTSQIARNIKNQLSKS